MTAESCVTVTAPSRPHCYTITVLHFTCDTITPYTLHITTLHISTQHLHCHQDAAAGDHTHAAVTLDIEILSLFYLGDKNNLPELIFIRSRHCQGGCWLPVLAPAQTGNNQTGIVFLLYFLALAHIARSILIATLKLATGC